MESGSPKRHTSKDSGRNIGPYPFTSPLPTLAKSVLTEFQPDENVVGFVWSFSAELHAGFDDERENSTGSHDLDLLELTYQIALELGVTVTLGCRCR